MKTIKDTDLNAELQELYLVGKQWLNDLDFLTVELAFIKKRVGEAFQPLLKRNEDIKMAKLLSTTINIDDAHLLLIADIKQFLLDIECQLEREEGEFDLRLMVRYEQLIEELAGLMQAYKLVKSKMFEILKLRESEPR